MSSNMLIRLAEDWMEDERWYVRWPATLAGVLIYAAAPVVIGALVLGVGALVVIALTS